MLMLVRYIAVSSPVFGFIIVVIIIATRFMCRLGVIPVIIPVIIPSVIVIIVSRIICFCLSALVFYKLFLFFLIVF